MDETLATRRNGGSARAFSSERQPIPLISEQKSGTRTSVVVVNDPRKLARFIPAWEELAAVALEPNVFYEHWMLLPALHAFGAGQDLVFVIVLIHDADDDNAPTKVGGMFPLQRMRRYKRLPVTTFRLWRHMHCYLATPLIRADAARDCLVAFLRWLRSREASPRVVDFWGVRAEGEFNSMLIEVANELNLLSWVSESHTRALLRKDRVDERAEPDISSELRRTLRRKERRLGERGAVEHALLRADDDVGRWIEEFLRLEASGWKGRHGSAMACTDANRDFFTRVATSAFRRGRLLMSKIAFEGKSIACGCGFTAGEGAFSFKTAYDEGFARFSPGVILEVDNYRQFHALPGVRWKDSCTASDNFVINRLWEDRTTIQSLAIGCGPWSELVISAAPMLRWIRRRLPRWRRDGLQAFSAEKRG
jgi:CelD/BcsL family acetyltransferase involved in cellulose biosynthesis